MSTHGARSDDARTTPIDRTGRSSRSLLEAKPRVVNIGLELFASELASLGVPVVHVDWRPPANADARLAALLKIGRAHV